MSVSSSQVAFADSKRRFEILDGLRGVAAIVVVIFHLFEAFPGGNHLRQMLNHGYLAVDFFFVLSGFVVGYAYDDRWNNMSLGDFFKRRLIRLHPMIIMGMIIGALCFYASASPVLFPHLAAVPYTKLLMVMLIGFTLIPVPLSMDIRGWAEMHPLNGPAWSLFFEYIANILYALVVRRFSNTLLTIFVCITGAALIHLAVTSSNGDVIGGWSLEPAQLRIGFTRLLYPFFAGLLLSRTMKPAHMRDTFHWCSILIVIILAFPRVGGETHLWANGLYDSLMIIIMFPLVVYLGANSEITHDVTRRVCNFLADISYPLYIVHYPLIYIFTAWVVDNNLAFGEAWLMALPVLMAPLAIAYGTLRLYDVPVRRWLAKRMLNR